MTDALQNLVAAAAEVREAEEQAKQGLKPTPEHKNPYGAKIHQLNLEWGAKRQAALDAIEADRQHYLQQVEDQRRLSAAWAAEHKGDPRPALRGRPAREWPEGVKILAALAHREGANKTAIRGILGIASTAKLNQLLDEGNALIQAEGAEER